MSISTKLKLRSRGQYTEVMALVGHPMDGGPAIINVNSKKEPPDPGISGVVLDKKAKKRPPAHYVEQLIFKLNGNVVAEASLGPAVSKNPLTAIALEGIKSGDTISVQWVDNQGGTGSASARV
jgi:sulfur-oxidizing protein SoxZ